MGTCNGYAYGSFRRDKCVFVSLLQPSTCTTIYRCVQLQTYNLLHKYQSARDVDCVVVSDKREVHYGGKFLRSIFFVYFSD